MSDSKDKSRYAQGRPVQPDWHSCQPAAGRLQGRCRASCRVHRGGARRRQQPERRVLVHRDDNRREDRQHAALAQAPVRVRPRGIRHVHRHRGRGPGAGAVSIYESVAKIASPSAPDFSALTLSVLVVAMLAKVAIGIAFVRKGRAHQLTAPEGVPGWTRPTTRCSPSARWCRP